MKNANLIQAKNRFNSPTTNALDSQVLSLYNKVIQKSGLTMKERFHPDKISYFGTYLIRQKYMKQTVHTYMECINREITRKKPISYNQKMTIRAIKSEAKRECDSGNNRKDAFWLIDVRDFFYKVLIPHLVFSVHKQYIQRKKKNIMKKIMKNKNLL